MPDTDLFGAPLPVTPLPPPPGQKPKRKTEVADGYAARPGTGPAGEKCRTCVHAVYVSHAKRYWKCGLVRHAWRGSVRTDIRLRSPACRFWEAIPTTAT